MEPWPEPRPRPDPRAVTPRAVGPRTCAEEGNARLVRRGHCYEIKNDMLGPSEPGDLEKSTLLI